MDKSEKEKMITGELFNVYDPELVAERGAARQQVEALNELGEQDPEKSQQLVKRLFGATGDQVEVHATFRCEYGYNIYVGEDFFCQLRLYDIRCCSHSDWQALLIGSQGANLFS